ncbi:MAG TPA: ribosome maturation factor RimP [Acidimicrobiales bacterium]|nr:ribosome maturation factor RimP [Acidimicrobiales bacterium]
MAGTDALVDLVDPLVADAGAVLYDLTRESGTVRVLVDHERGVDLDLITAISRDISAAFDEADVMSGAYTLEVSSPGLERPLRTAEHFAGAVGEVITVRLTTKIDGARRVKGTLAAVDGELVTVEPDDGNPIIRFPIDAVQKARTVFVWERGEKPGSRSTSATSHRKATT